MKIRIKPDLYVLKEYFIETLCEKEDEEEKSWQGFIQN